MKSEDSVFTDFRYEIFCYLYISEYSYLVTISGPPNKSGDGEKKKVYQLGSWVAGI